MAPSPFGPTTLSFAPLWGVGFGSRLGPTGSTGIRSRGSAWCGISGGPPAGPHPARATRRSGSAVLQMASLRREVEYGGVVRSLSFTVAPRGGGLCGRRGRLLACLPRLLSADEPEIAVGREPCVVDVEGGFALAEPLSVPLVHPAVSRAEEPDVLGAGAADDADLERGGHGHVGEDVAVPAEERLCRASCSCATGAGSTRCPRRRPTRPSLSCPRRLGPMRSRRRR